jgi:hypothetical protein
MSLKDDKVRAINQQIRDVAELIVDATQRKGNASADMKYWNMRIEQLERERAKLLREPSFWKRVGLRLLRLLR